MQWEILMALVVAAPIILFPIAFIRYLNIGNFDAAIQESRARRMAFKEYIKQAKAEDRITNG